MTPGLMGERDVRLLVRGTDVKKKTVIRPRPLTATEKLNPAASAIEARRRDIHKIADLEEKGEKREQEDARARERAALAAQIEDKAILSAGRATVAEKRGAAERTAAEHRRADERTAAEHRPSLSRGRGPSV